MLKLIKLFSFVVLILSYAFSSVLTESISLRVKVIGKIQEEKPRLLPPEKINLEEKEVYLDLSKELLEPPQYLEEAVIEPVQEGKGCGEPKDRVYYRAGVNYYLKGNLKKAEGKLLDVLSIQNSAFIPQTEYILGLIYSKTGREKESVSFFKSSCFSQHPYKTPACEALYALEFKLKGQPADVDSPDLWNRVYRIKIHGDLEAPKCDDTVFKTYCKYVTDFVEGRVNDEYRESAELRRAIILLKENRLTESKELLEKYSQPLSRYRDIAFYYLGIIAYKEGNRQQAYRYASLLEISKPEYSKSLYLLLSKKDILFSRIAYRLTGSSKALRNSGILSYNAGEYKVAYAELTKAGEPLLAAWAAIKEGDYGRAYSSLKRVKDKNRNYYLWLLEILYWLGKNNEMEKVLKEIKDKYPDIYREYMGWLMFRKEDWLNAYRYFEDPYHRALALYNAGRYKNVIDILKERRSLKERLLKAKAAISMGNGELARKFLTDESDEEIYLTGMSFFIEGKYREAIRYFEGLLKKGALKSRAILRIADSYYNLGDYERAKRYYKEILSLYPDSREALDATLALAQIELQRPSSDLKHLIKEFVKKFPSSPMISDLKYQLANLYIKEGKKDKAKNILKELLQNDTYRAKALIKLAEVEEDPKRKEELLKEVIITGSGEEKERATTRLMNLYLETKEFEKLADFLSKGSYEDKKRALGIYISENIEKAIKLFDELVKENPDDEELKEKALELYDKTKGKKFLFYAKDSQNPKVRAKALYELGRFKKRKDKRKALEYFVEVILSARGVQPYYNRSILEAVDILLSLKARKDASCLLEKLDPRYLTKKEAKRVKILRKKLPKCEVKK